MATVEIKQIKKRAHPIKTNERIYTLLCEGWCGRRIATHLKLAESVVRGHIKRLTQKGLIERITKKPAFYRKVEKRAHPISYSAHALPSNVEQARMLPATLGANFLLITKHGAKIPTLKYNSRGTHTKIVLGSVPHTRQFHRYKAQLWLHSAAFRGSNPDEIIDNGKKQIMALAASYERQFNITLTLSHFYKGEEWVMVDDGLSEGTAKSAGIAHGGQIEVGESIHKYADFSHPNSFQFNTQRGAFNQDSARDDARTHRYLYERLPGDLEAITKAMQATADAVVSIKTAQEVMMRQMKKETEG